MEEESTPSIAKNKEIIDVMEFPEKTEDAKQNILRLIVGNNAIGSGFLCKIYIEKDKPMPALITCYHVVDENYMKNNEILYFSYLSNKVKTEVVLDLNIKRIIYQDEYLDITIIEIKEQDNLDIYSFLEMDPSINIDDLLYKKVYLLHYPQGVENVQYSHGEISDLIDDINLSTNNWTEPGSSGSPIINYENNYVIGIHSRSLKDGKDITGIGTFLNYAVKEFAEEKSEEIKSSYKSLYPKSDEMHLVYLIPNNQKSIKLFCNKFVDKYKELCKLIYNGHTYSLNQYFQTDNIAYEDKIKGEIKIILKGIEHVKNMEFMFSRCKELKKVIATGTDFSKVEIMDSTFERCDNLEEITNTSKWNLENVKTLKGLFYKCPKLKDIPGMEKWNPINIKTCEEMFLSCKSLDASVVAKVEKWKNVPKYIKDDSKKGYTSKNIIAYAMGDNLGGTVKYFANQINIFKKK